MSSDAAERAASTTAAAGTTRPGEAVDYAAQYLALVAPSNCAAATVRAITNEVNGPDEQVSSSDWPAIRDRVLRATKAYSESLVAFHDALLAAEWPAEVRPDIDRLARDRSIAAEYWRSLSEAASYASFLDLLGPPETGDAARSVRAGLGLPSAVVGDEGRCPVPS